MMRLLIMLMAIVTCAMPNIAHGDESSHEGAYANEINELAQAYASVFGFSGSVKVVKSGEPIFEESFGLANRSFQIENAVTQPISINSISKTFTATAIMMLVEAEQIDLTQPIARYLPALSADWKHQVTVHHLLTHTSGLPRESGINWYDELSLEQQVQELVSQQALLFAPGDRYEYSNSGITLLGRIIENLSGQTYKEFITEQIIKPLNLAHTGVYEGRRMVPQQVVPYRVTATGVAEAQRTKHLGQNAGGGMYSTVGDLYKFVVALEQHKLLREETTALMFTPHVDMGGDATAYGWTLKPFGDSELRFASGSGYGTKSVVVRAVDSNDFIAVTSNWGNTPILQFMAGLFLLINDREYDIPDRNMLAQPAQYSDALGHYVFEPGELKKHLMTDSHVMTLQDIDGRLFLNDELLAKKEGATLGLTYTNEIVIELEPQRMVISINGNRLTGRLVSQERAGNPPRPEIGNE